MLRATGGRRLAVGAALIAALAACAPRAAPTTAHPAIEAQASAPAIERGRRIAQDWCASCHIVAPDQARVANPAAGAPRFADVAHRWAESPAALRRFMDELHLPMPTFRLWPPERDDVAAYLVSLDRPARLPGQPQ